MLQKQSGYILLQLIKSEIKRDLSRITYVDERGCQKDGLYGNAAIRNRNGGGAPEEPPKMLQPELNL